MVSESSVLKPWIEVARVSNLPTIVSNALLAYALVFSEVPGSFFFIYLFLGVFAYTAGMLLNDVFDLQHDRQHQPFRPIARGDLKRSQVAKVAWGFLALFIVIFNLNFILLGKFSAVSAAVSTFVPLLIVIYSKWHKGFWWAPAVMGACRAAFVVTPALSLGVFHPMFTAVVVAEWLFVIVVSLVARSRFARYTATMVASVSLVDAIFLLFLGFLEFALIATFCSALTTRLQKWVRGD